MKPRGRILKPKVYSKPFRNPADGRYWVCQVHELTWIHLTWRDAMTDALSFWISPGAMP